jgi:uncharacterized membrane protein
MNIEVLLAAPWHIQLHVVSASGALGLGLIQLIASKGTLPHRTLGYVWVALMASTAITAIFIRTGGSFSWIHLFVPLVLVSIVDLSIRGRQGLVGKHRRNAMTLFFGALLIPGAFAFLPGRLMHSLVVG